MAANLAGNGTGRAGRVADVVPPSRLGVKPTYDRSAGSFTPGCRTNAVPNPLLPSGVPDVLSVPPPAVRAGGVRTSSRTRQVEGSSLAGAGKPQGRFPAVASVPLPPDERVRRATRANIEAFVRRVVVPARNILKAGGADHAAAVHGRRRVPAPCAAAPVVVVRPEANDGLRLLDGLRVGVNASIRRKNGTRR